MQRNESPPPRGVIQFVTSIVPRRLVFPAPTTIATASPQARAVRLDFSTSISELPVQTLATRAHLECTSLDVQFGLNYSSDDILRVVNAEQDTDDDRPTVGVKARQASSSDSVSTLGFGMSTFSSQDLLLLDYAEINSQGD